MKWDCCAGAAWAADKRGSKQHDKHKHRGDRDTEAQKRVQFESRPGGDAFTEGLSDLGLQQVEPAARGLLVLGTDALLESIPPMTQPLVSFLVHRQRIIESSLPKVKRRALMLEWGLILLPIGNVGAAMVVLRNIVWSLILSLVLGLILAPRAHAELVNIAILHTNDTCGRLESFYYRSTRPLGGVAKRAMFFQEKRRHGKLHWLTVDAGNRFGYTRMSYYFEGFLDTHMSNWLGYDAVGIGATDFIFGREVLEAREKESKAPFICTNVLDSATGKYIGEPFKIVDFAGFRVALMGLADTRIPDSYPTDFTRGLVFRDPEQVVSEWIPQLRGQSDVIMLLSTLPLQECIALADRHPEIAVIISGGEGAALQVPLKVGPALIVQAGKWGMNVGLLKVTFEGDSNGGYHLRYFDERLVPMDGKWVENTKFLQELSTYHERLDEKLGIVLGKIATDMPAIKVNSYETKLGDLFTDALRSATGADVALLDAGSFRDGLLAGAVTKGDLYRAYPGDALVMTGTVNGEDLRKILSQGAGMVGREGFLQVSGATFGIYGANAYDVKVQGENIDPARLYRLAITDRMLDGFGGLTSMYLVQDVEPSGKLVREVVGDYLVEKREFTNEVEGRITYYAEPLEEEVAVPEESPPEEVAPPEEKPTAEESTKEPEAGAEVALPEAPEQPAEEGPLVAPPAEEPPGEYQVKTEEEVDTGLAPPSEPATLEEAAAAVEAPEQVPRTPSALVGETSQVIEGVSYHFQVEQMQGEGEPLLSLKVTLTNNSDAFKLFDFPTSQHFDFAVFQEQKLLWQWSYNRYFVQAESSLRLDPGQSKTFVVHWDGMTNKKVPVRRGLYRFSALVTAVPEREISFTALFEPPLM